MSSWHRPLSRARPSLSVWRPAPAGLPIDEPTGGRRIWRSGGQSVVVLRAIGAGGGGGAYGASQLAARDDDSFLLARIGARSTVVLFDTAVQQVVQLTSQSTRLMLGVQAVPA